MKQSIQSGTKRTGKYFGSSRQKHDAICYGMLAPQIIGFFVFTLYPILWAVKWAFYRYTGLPSDTRFVGLANFKTLFTQDTRYWSALLNSFLFAVCKLPIEIPLALILALILQKKMKGSNFFQAVYFLPNIISTAIIGIMFSSMFAHFGIINAMLQRFGIIAEKISWFSEKKTAMFVIVIASVWNTFGINVLYFMSALANVPEEIYESARLDGAGTFQQFFKITIPLISPVMRIIMMLAIYGTLATSDFILMLTNGGPGGTTEVVMTYLLKNIVPGFVKNGASIGYGTSMAVVTSFVLAFTSLMYLKFSKNKME